MIRILLLILLVSTAAEAQYLERVESLRREWRFSIGDHEDWASPDFDDRDWEEIRVPNNWENEGFFGYDGYAWYRTTFSMDEIDRNRDYYLLLGYIDDVDRTYVNGQLIGKSGNFPPGFRTAYKAKREYRIPAEVLKHGENTIAVQVFDKYGEGGINGGTVGVFAAPSESFEVDLRGIWRLKKGDDRAWKDRGYDDEDWAKVNVPSPWERQGFDRMDGIAWYRKEFRLTTEQVKYEWVLIVGRIDDFDKTYLNGVYVGGTADFKGYGRSTSFSKMRVYEVPANVLRAGTNLISIRVEDIGNVGGIYDGPVGLVRKSDFDPNDLPRFNFFDHK